IENLQRAADLIQVSENILGRVRPFKNEVYKKTKKTLGILGDLASFKRDDKWYEKLSKAETQYLAPIYKYKNLSNYINLRELSGKIDLNKVRKELDTYTGRLKNELSYKDYNNIASKINDHVEYYRAVYAAAENGDFISFIEEYPNLYLFLTYSIRSSAVNPILVFYDEETYINKILSSEANDNAKFEDLLLYRMTSLLDPFLSLSMTDSEFEYFSGNVELYKTLISERYANHRDLVFTYLNNSQYYKYYRANIDRNGIFFDNLVKNISGDDGKINIFVSGGFHTSLIEDFKKQNISYVLITPVVLEDFNSVKVYNKLIEINSSVPRVLRNALNPIPFMLAALPQIPAQSRQAYFDELINSIVGSSRNYRSPAELQSVIEQWCKNISGLNESDISAAYNDDTFQVKILEQSLEFKVKNGLIDFKESELFIPETEQYKSIRTALNEIGYRFTPFSPSVADHAKDLALRVVNKAEYMAIKGKYYSRVSKRKENLWAFRFMRLFYRLNFKKIAGGFVAAMAWSHVKSSDSSVQARQTTLEIEGRTINVVIEQGIDLSDDELLEIIERAKDIRRETVPIKQFPDTLFLGMIDSSSHLFENYTGIGFIGINKAVFEIGKSKTDDDIDGKNAQDIQKIILKSGITHEIAHEFLGDVKKNELDKFENAMLIKDIDYIIKEIKKLHTDERSLKFYNEVIKNRYILPYLTGILEGSDFLRRLEEDKLTLDEVIDILNDRPLSDDDMLHLEDAYLIKSEKRKNNEEKLFSSIVLQKKHTTANDKNRNSEIEILRNKFKDILVSTEKFDEMKIEKMSDEFSRSIAEGIDVVYKTLPDHLFERYFNDKTMLKE
ncbi:MAG: hypothetical protein LBL00_08175, partial [Endomicrobium sp.]|nr:hypothetical protein [Endomicrobium sp.]